MPNVPTADEYEAMLLTKRVDEGPAPSPAAADPRGAARTAASSMARHYVGEGEVAPDRLCELVQEHVIRHFGGDLSNDEIRRVCAAALVDARRGDPIDGETFVQAFRPPEWLLPGVFPRKIVATITGHTGHGKTAIAAPLAVQAHVGGVVSGRRFQPGRVIYCAAENPHDVQTRLVGACQALGVAPADLREFYVLPGARPLTRLVAEVHDLGAKAGALSLVVVDTSAAVFEGEDENDNVAQQRHGERLRHLTDAKGGPTVLVLAHPKLGAGRDALIPRGGSALIANVDANYTVWKGDDDVIELHATKLRGPPFEPIQFDLQRRVLEGYRDSLGNEVTAGIALASGGGRDKERELRDKHIEDDNQVLRSLKNDGYRSLHYLAERCGWKRGEQVQKWRAQRSIERLEVARLVEKFRDGFQLSKAGEREVEKLGRIG